MSTVYPTVPSLCPTENADTLSYISLSHKTAEHYMDVPTSCICNISCCVCDGASLLGIWCSHGLLGNPLPWKLSRSLPSIHRLKRSLNGSVETTFCRCFRYQLRLLTLFKSGVSRKYLQNGATNKTTKMTYGETERANDEVVYSICLKFITCNMF